MRRGFRHCVICGKWFCPDPRADRVALCCSGECSRERRRRVSKRWRDKSGYFQTPEMRKKRETVYWPAFIKNNPNYRQRYREMRKARRNAMSNGRRRKAVCRRTP